MQVVRLPRWLGVIGISTLIAVLAQASGAWAQGTWTVLAPVPAKGSGVEGMAVGLIGAKIVAAYGFDNGFGDTTRTRIYDIGTDTWSHGSNAPGPERSEGTAVTFQDQLYAIGGRNASFTVIGSLDRYSPATDTWVALPPMPTARAGLGAAVVDGAIYAIGGRLTGGGPCSEGLPRDQLARVERFDIASRTWSTVASLPSARSDVAAVTVHGKIYVFGGCRMNSDGSISFLSDVDVYDPATNTWSTTPSDLPTARAAFYQVGKVGHKVYVICGWDGGNSAVAVNEVYNAKTNSWASAASPPTPRGEMGVVSFNGSVYTVGGSLPAFGNSSNANEVFTP